MEKILKQLLRDAVASLNWAEAAGEIDIEIPKEGFGDLSTPITMSLARHLKMPPRKIAEQIVAALASPELFESITIAGPGFINFTLSRQFLSADLKTLIHDEDRFLTEDIGKGKRIQVEFVSANPTGPLHLGHGRGAALGAALGNLLSAAGYRVVNEYYINDAGRQVLLLGLSVFARYKQLLGIEYAFPEDGYKGEYIEDLARELKERHGNEFAHAPFEEVSALFIDFSYTRMLEAIKKDLTDFGVSFQVWQSERELYASGAVQQSIEDLKARNCIYEKEGALWFKSTDFGDDKDRVIVKKDGEYTYFASDIAYHRQKIEQGYDELIDIWGADHHGYIPRMHAVIQALGYPKDHLRVLLVQIVTLLRGGKPVQMSKRAGEFITLREVIDEIGADTTKFLFLTRRSDSHLEIDIDVAKAQSQENPVFYVQYAHARIHSIFEKARQEGYEISTDFNGEAFNDEEMRIIKKLLTYPMMFRNAALAHEPHRITFYLQELAGLFHPYYHKYRVVTDDPALTNARLALCNAVRIVLKHGLSILGVSAPEKM